MTVDLRPVSSSSDLLEVRVDGVSIGAVRLVVAGSVATMTIQLDVLPALEQDIGALIVAAVARAGEQGATDIEFHCQSLLVRHEARRVGFGGALRSSLGAKTDDVVRPATIGPATIGPATIGGAGAVPDRRDRMAWLVAALNDMGVVSTAARRARALGRLARRLAGGVGDTLEVVIEWAPGRTFIVSAPDRFDIMPEAIALAGDTTSAVLNRFPDQAVAVRFVYFDRAIYELKAGRYAGMTEGSAPSIHLNVGFVVTEVHREMVRQRDDEEPQRSSSARPPPPYTALDGTVAHELWHKIESVFEARDYRSSIDFRRMLGHHLGVETLEQAVKGAGAKSPATWQAAHRRLVDEVSPYASTNAHEATAEMFKLWWCRHGPPSAVVARFGELVDQFVPP